MNKAKNTPEFWSEDRLQQEIVKWFNNEFPQYRGLLFHVGNGGARDGREAKKLKFMGVYAGVADLVLLIGGCSFIELKRPDGKGIQSKAQKEWEKAVTNVGFEYVIFNDLLETKDFIYDKIINFEHLKIPIVG